MGSRFVHELPRVGYGAIVAAVLVVPVAFSRGLADPFQLTKATLLWLAAILAVLGVVVQFMDERWPVLPRPRALLPIGLLVGWTALATLLSDAPLISLVGSYGRYDGLVSLLACVALALGVVAFTWRDVARLEVLAAAIVVGGAIGFTYVALEQVGLAPVDWHLSGTDSGVVGLGGNPNFSGAHLAMVVPVVLAGRRRCSATWQRRTCVGLAVAIGVGVWWTGTRGGLVALVGGVAAVGVLLPEVMPKPVRIAAIASLGVVLIGIVGSGTVGPLPVRPSIGSHPGLAIGGLDQRGHIWSGAASMIAEHPVVGVGPDGFGRAFPKHRSSRGELPLIAADEAHDVFLDRAATAGVPALAAQLWLLVLVAVGAWRARRSVPEPQRWLVGAFGGMLAAYLFQGAFSIDVVALAMLGWVAIGALMALGDPAVVSARLAGEDERTVAKRRRTSPGSPSTAKPAATVTVVVLGVLATSLLAGSAIRPALADRRHRQAQEALAAKRPADALRRDQQAASWLGHEPTYQLAQAQDLVAYATQEGLDPALRRMLIDEAILAYAKALERAPGDTAMEAALAEVHVLAAEAAASSTSALGHFDIAEEIYLGQLRDLEATDDLHLPYGRLLEMRAQHAAGPAEGRLLAEAVAQFELARSYRPDRGDALVALARVHAGQRRWSEAREVLAEAIDLEGETPTLRAAITEVERQLAAADD